MTLVLALEVSDIVNPIIPDTLQKATYSYSYCVSTFRELRAFSICWSFDLAKIILKKIDIFSVIVPFTTY